MLESMSNIRKVKESRYSFSEAIPISFNRLKSVFFSCPIAVKCSPIIWLWIEICENVGFSKIDITVTTINKKTLKIYFEP